MKNFSEPILALMSFFAIPAGAGAFFATSSASTTTQTIATAATPLLIHGIGWIARHFVAPAWKVVEAKAAAEGVDVSTVPTQLKAELFPEMSDEDFAKVDLTGGVT